MRQGVRFKDRFYNWLLSDGFPLHLAFLMVISTVFDFSLTFQVLFNDKGLFLELEQNKFLIYTSQNNLWWLYSIWYVFSYFLLLWVSMHPNNPYKRATRAMSIALILNQLSQPLVFIFLIN